MKPVLIKEDLYFVGVFDPDIRTFDIIMKTANGSSYNAYLLKTDAGVVVFDGVKEEFGEEYFAKIESLCDYDEIKYIIVHHLEPDHSGTLPQLISRAKNAKVMMSPQANLMIKAVVHSDEIQFETVWSGKSIQIGGKTIKFLSTPYLHWPETISSVLVEDKVLFSGDVFGSHYFDKKLFDDLVGDFDYAFKYYYDHIMRPFKRHVLNALKLYDSENIELIAPLHGPIIRQNPIKYINLYKSWSEQKGIFGGKGDKKIISIFYLTSYKNTKDMAESIELGCESEPNVVVNVYDLASLEENNVLNLLEESDGILIGTPTINGDAPKPAWDALSCMMLLEKTGKTGGAFGSYGWSGEAPNMINDRMKALKFRVPLEPLKIKLIPTQNELDKAYEFGKEFAQIVNGKMVEMEM
jgi:flavorubredoxin